MSPVAVKTPPKDSNLPVSKDVPATIDVAAGKAVTITCTEVTWMLLGDVNVLATRDHRSAQLQPGLVYRFASSTRDNRLSARSDKAQSVAVREEDPDDAVALPVAVDVKP
jgi:hypothetical protein